MSLFSEVEAGLESPFKKLEAEFEATVPAAMKADLGPVLSAAFVSNVKYDLKTAGKSVEALAVADMSTIYATVKSAASAALKNVVSGQYPATVAGLVENLGSVAVTSVVPEMVLLGKNTLTALVSVVSQLVMAATPAPVAPPVVTPSVPKA